MTGARRLFFAACAALLRAAAWLPLWAGNGLADLADRCDQRARSTPPGDQP